MARTVFLTYGTDELAPMREAMVRSALATGFDEAIALGPEALAGIDFARRNAATLAASRGAGFWLWKPWLIREHLARLGGDDVLVYSDCGRTPYYRWTRFPEALIARTCALAQGFTVGPVLHQHGPLARWCKRDALVLLEADRPEVFEAPCVQASPNFWRPTPAAFALLDAWLAAAEDPRILTDLPNTCGLPNHPGFVDHRHDQAVLSILVHRDRLPVLDLADSGIFRLMALRPDARAAHRFLKSPSNIERVYAGAPYRLALLGEALSDRLGLPASKAR